MTVNCGPCDSPAVRNRSIDAMIGRPMAESLKAALVDIGGTLWPNSWPVRATDGEGRLAGLRCVVASNTYWRDAESYWDDFRLLGWADSIDAVVTSVDAGHLKPHPAVFELAVKAAGVPAERCVVIGNKEANDVAPALAMGMQAILVYPDDLPPASTGAQAVAADLWECARALRVMLGR